MQEIWIPELLIGFFLLLAIIGRVFRKLSASKGLMWLPLPAFFIAIGLFPAYGFRPEALPLVVFTVIITLTRLPDILSTLGRSDTAGYNEGKILFALPAIVLLCAALALAAIFSPVETPAYASRVYAFSAKDGMGRDYFFRVYRNGEETGIPGEKRPLLVLAPPLFGSPAGAEKLCNELLGRNFTVLTYSRRGFDAPALNEEGKSYGISLPERFRRGRAFLSGAGPFRSSGGNEEGRLLEKERKDDILFVLSRVLLNPRLGEGLALFDIAGRNQVFLGAYDAGAAALISLAGDRGFVRSRPFIKGVIAIEPSLWPAPAGGEPPGSVAADSRIPPWQGYPLLLLASDRILDGSPGRQYEAIRLCMESALSPVILAALEGAGPLDYSDFPLRYPLVSAFFPGRRRGAFVPREAAAAAASLIARFAFRALEAENPDLQGVPPELPANIHIESRNTLNLF
jgi:hypothetical protein